MNDFSWRSLVFVFCLWLPLTASVTRQPCDTYYRKDRIQLVSFYPTHGELGIFPLGAKPQARLVLSNLTNAPLHLQFSCTLKDYYGQQAGPQLQSQGTLQAKEKKSFDVIFPSSTKKGSFTAFMNISSQGEKLAETQTNFCVITKSDSKPDPFFAFDKNYMIGTIFFEAGRIMGIGTIGLGSYGFPKYPRKDDDGPVKRAKALAEKLKIRFANYPDYRILIYAVPHLAWDNQQRLNSRRQNHLAPRSDEDYLYARIYYETLARELKDRTQQFIVQEEFDAEITANLPKTYTETLNNFVLTAKNVYAGIKAGNPQSRLAVLGICMQDYYRYNPPFRFSRIVLHDLGPCFDDVCIDAYSGNYDAVAGPLVPPERDFRKMLLDTAKLSASFGRPYRALNSERCYCVNYFDSFQSSDMRDMTNYTARSLIIAKSAPCPLYVIHLCQLRWNVSQRLKGRTPGKPWTDWGLWKAVPDEHDKDARIPRPVVAAIATTAQELAFAEKPQEVIVDKTVYGYVFQGGGLHAGKSVTALWSMQEKPLPVSLNLPADAQVTDLMGNTVALPKGKAKLVLTGAPCFIKMSCQPQDAVKMISASSFMRKPLFSAFSKRSDDHTLMVHVKNHTPFPFGCSVMTDNQTKLLKQTQLQPFKTNSIALVANPTLTQLTSGTIQLKTEGRPTETIPVPLDYRYHPVNYLNQPFKVDHPIESCSHWTSWTLRSPENIYPADATMRECGFFLNPATDPNVKLHLAWNQDALYIVAQVNDIQHIQRHHGTDAWKDDCLKFGIHLRPGRLPLEKSAQEADDIHVFTLALTETGTEFTRLHGGNTPSGAVSCPARVTRTASSTIYKACLPWQDLRKGFKPAAGMSLGFNAVIANVDHIENLVHPYCFQLAPGLTEQDVPDLTQFATIILSK